MNLQHERIAALCTKLKLERIATEWTPLAQEAARNEASFAEFLERLLMIESDALNDPAATSPDGTLLNGRLTVALPGTRVRSFVVNDDDFHSDNDSYASVAGRGLSRAYFTSIGLPPAVINQLFRKPMTLKFGIRAQVQGPIQQAYFSYQFRLLGN